MQHIDQLQHIIHLPTIPKRIISLVPSQTELLCHLGLEDAIVGITKFCVHPTYLKSQKTIVGGTKQVKLDTIKALHPDIVICNKEENTEAIVQELQTIAPVWVSDIHTVNDALHMIELLGDIFDVTEKAEHLVKEIRYARDDFKKYIQIKPRRKVAYLIWKNPWMLAGTNTYINELLLLNNYINIAFEGSRYPEINTDTLLDADLVLLSSEPFPFKEKHVAELRELLNKEIRLVDGEYFSWYGSRLKEAFSYFKKLH